jgi:AcrR family transcriptional regulator
MPVTDTPAPQPAVKDDASTRERILLAAEELFARHGYDGTSLRTIMSQANVNTGAIHYHFRTKEKLLEALFDMRVKEMNAERTALLTACEPERADDPPQLAAVLRAFLGPAIRFSRSPSGANFNLVSALCSVDPNDGVRQIAFSAYGNVSRRFVELLRRASPWLSEEAFFWRLNCLFGSMMYLRTNNGRVAQLVDRDASGSSADAVLDELVLFVEAGFAAGRDTAR